MSFIPRTVFTTDIIPAKDRFDVFRDSMSVLYDAELDDASKSKPFDANVDAFMLDQTMLLRTQASSGIYNRGNLDIRQDGNDMYLISLFLKGGDLISCGKISTIVKTGDIAIYDLNRKSKNTVTDFANLSFVFPRDLIESYIPTISNFHCQILPRDQPMTILLRSHMLSLYEAAPGITTESSASLQRSLLELTSTAVHQSKGILPKHEQTVINAVLVDIRRWINSRLADPELSADSICRAFSLSRTQLYRVTEPLGGIMNHIREQRLKKSYADLRDPALVHLSVSDTLYRWGFNDPGTFTRSFKKRFGMLPKDVKNLPLTQQSEKALSDSIITGDGFDDWIRTLSI